MSHSKTTYARPKNPSKPGPVAAGNLHSRPPVPKNHVQEASLLLNLIHHRNKNQHHTQKWWKWLCMLRRSMRRLLEFEERSQKGTGWLKRDEEDRKQKVEKWLKEVVVPGSWVMGPTPSDSILTSLAASARAFSTVVADTQFSALGVVLIALLARVGRIVGLPKAKPVLPTDEIKVKRLLEPRLPQMGEDIGEAVARDDGVEGKRNVQERQYPSPQPQEASEDMTSANESIGKAVKDLTRQSNSLETPENVNSGNESSIAQDLAKEHIVTKPKKRRKKGNPIDDLFSNLI